MSSLKEVREKIRLKESEASSVAEELNSLRAAERDLERLSDQEHFDEPVPGDFWHEMYTPFFIVLAAEDGLVTICEKTKTVYEEPEKAMVLRSYESPDDPEVKEYFSRPRKDIGYTFDVSETRTVSRGEFEKMLKCYSGALADELAYRCMPGRCTALVSMWRAGLDGGTSID